VIIAIWFTIGFSFAMLIQKITERREARQREEEFLRICRKEPKPAALPLNGVSTSWEYVPLPVYIPTLEEQRRSEWMDYAWAKGITRYRWEEGYRTHSTDLQNEKREGLPNEIAEKKTISEG
jgi:hypothetical protein